MRKHVLAITIGVFAAAGSAFAQTPQENIAGQWRESQAFQQAVVFNSSGSRPVVAGMIGSDGRMGMINVTGKPFSATEVRKSTQTLGNGAKIEHSDSNLLYRDDQGRTRAEQTLGGKTVVVIMDPVARSVYVLNTDTKTARKTSIPATAQEGGATVTNGGVTMQWRSTSTSTSGSANVAMSEALSSASAMATTAGLRVRSSTPDGHHTVEDLGMQLVNGVMAQGTRDTLTIPAQSIGNDQELQVVDEHWFSSDLQMLVKSVNSDPRFGDTTYQLTNVLRGGQDPTLFQVPADYTISSDTKFEIQAKPAVVK